MNVTDLRICDFSMADSLIVNQVKSTYTNSFPPEERRDFSLLLQLLSTETKIKLYIFLDPVAYIGFIIKWEFDSFIYLEHFAIDHTRRSEGWGSKCLKTFIHNIEKPVLLEVEVPDDSITKRRIVFYERLGFIYHAFPYLQPPYRSGERMLPMHLMSYGNLNMDLEYKNIKRTIYRHVYGFEE